MIEIKSNSDKRSDISKVSYIDALNSQFVDYPGNYCECVGNFLPIKFSSVSMVEDDAENGAPISQELSIDIRGQNQDIDNQVLQVTGKYILLKLEFSNGDVKIVGTKDNPVVLSTLKSEKPLMTTLSTTRTSAEKAKYLVV